MRRIPKVYIAARSEDRGLALGYRAGLEAHEIRCTSRWLDLADLTGINVSEARMDLADIVRADVFILVQSDTAHRDTTGGHHVEFGYALALSFPILLIGERRNVFHALRNVRIVNRQIEMVELAALVHEVTPR